ncbi:hypothetical protein F945_00625 [Acinetobacter rudis CIP 110305]|uniref:PAAR domain-containing protein n=1 Tax=Acinetobacter rudis CIP 110305 TaxID=421052 RepID=S3NJC7_9GAMM|nr:hypothetical protein F945_00625 [Acinetobacter rudis CIP 110305]
MMNGFAIHNAPTDHGGIIPATQMRSSQMGNLFVVAGDGHFCPKCKCWSIVLKSHDRVIFDGKAVAYAGDQLSCGARILLQQSHVVGGGQSANYNNFTASNLQLSNSWKNVTNSLLAEDKKRLNGHYYNIETGSFEGKVTDGIGQIEDLYACNGKDGNDYKDKKKLEMTHSDFQKNAFILAEEAGDSGQECICLGFTASNRAKELSWALFKLLSTTYSSVPKSLKGTLLASARADIKSKNTRKGLLQSLSGYEDPTKGATFWDGTDFLAWGLKSPFQGGVPHAKFREYKKITINKHIYEKYRAATLKIYPKGSVVYTKYNYISSVPSQVFIDPKNWSTGNFIYITNARNASKSIIATVCEGHTVFWKTY